LTTPRSVERREQPRFRRRSSPSVSVGLSLP
jgi:hypothetical protein